jgi:hypothetical protein
MDRMSLVVGQTICDAIEGGIGTSATWSRPPWSRVLHAIRNFVIMDPAATVSQILRLSAITNIASVPEVVLDILTRHRHCRAVGGSGDFGDTAWAISHVNGSGTGHAKLLPSM